MTLTDAKELVALFFISAGPLLWGLHTLYFGLLSNRWLTAEGKIVRSKISKTEFVAPLTNWDKPALFAYQPDIRFEYEVNGEKYIGDRIKFGFGEGTITAEGSKKKARALKAGTAVNVHYQPSNPQKSTLISGINASTALLSLLLIAFGAFIALLFVAEFARIFKIHLY